MLGLIVSALLVQPPEAASPGAAELEPIPFPLEESAGPKEEPRKPRQAEAKKVPIVDLRDPFAIDAKQRRRGGRAALVRLGIPDLKDPFSTGRRLRPRGWHIQLPGDIRDPFSPKLKHRYLGPRCVDGHMVRTTDGVQIQRPDDVKEGKKKKPKAGERCRSTPFDLRDPFAQ